VGVVNAPIPGAARVSLGPEGLALVQRWIDDPATNRGVILQTYADGASDGATFKSMEAASVADRPAIVLSYVAP